MMKCRGLLLAAMLLSPGLADTAAGGIVLVTSRGALGGTDSLDWGEVGPQYTQPGSPFVITSAGGLDATVAGSLGVYYMRVDQAPPLPGWTGNFAPGEELMYSIGGLSTTIDFGAPLRAFGFQVQPSTYGPFTALLEALDSVGSVVGSVSRDGNSTSDADGSAIFIGLFSDAPATDFSRIRISIAEAGEPNFYFTFNRADFIPAGAAAATPEPGSLALAATGALGLVLVARVRRRR